MTEYHVLDDASCAWPMALQSDVYLQATRLSLTLMAATFWLDNAARARHGI
jgi:hypothetical protein